MPVYYPGPCFGGEVNVMDNLSSWCRKQWEGERKEFNDCCREIQEVAL